jgi:DNA phosphorothioation-dependent restriction protein DptH
MKHLINTIVNYIVSRSTAEPGTYRFVLPSYPAEVLLGIGKEIDEQLKRIHDRRIRLKYGVAYRLGKQWYESGTPAEKDCFSNICSKGWYNEGNNLTSLRNKLKEPEDDGLVILLAGYDHIDDRASLQDFFHLDQEALWTICLKRSFKTWVINALRQYVNPEDSELDILNISDVFRALYDYGLADLLDISRYLESQDFSVAMSGKDAYQLVLSNLKPFKLPVMIGLSRKHSKKNFHHYIVPAQECFNYSMFINETNRKKYISRATKYLQESEDDLDREMLGGFESKEDLVSTLQDYIENRSIESSNQLRNADFIYIYERILGHKSKSKTRTEKKPAKLTGLPPEIFLRAMWSTLGDYKKEANRRGILIAEDLTKVTLRSLVFKHDFDAGDEEELDSVDDKQMAQAFLCRVLGGVDQYLEDQIRIQLGDRGNKKDILFNSYLCPGENNDSLSYKKSSTAEPSLRFEVVIYFGDNESYRREFIWPIPQNHQCSLLVDFYNLAVKGYLNAANALPAFSIPYLTEIFMARDEEEVNRLIGTALNSENCNMIDLTSVLDADGRDEARRLKVDDLSIQYQKYLREFQKSGFFSVLDKYYDGLRKAYCDTFETFLKESAYSTFAPLLLKAFMVVPIQGEQEVHEWIWQDYLEAAVVTPLHPAVLEMIRHQHTYLCDSFCFYAKRALEESGTGAFSIKRWDRVADHSKIHWPIFGILKDANRVLDTNMRSYNYFHLIGDSQETPSLITSRLLLRYDDVEDEEITDTELFHETQSSRLIKQVLLDYKDLYPFANDGISIGSYCGKEIQPVIAGIDSYLVELLTEQREREYSLQLTIFSDSRDDSSIMQWVNAWKDRWQAAELSSGKQYYSNCRISISYRVVSMGDNGNQFRNLLQGIGLDIMIFSNFIRAGASNFEPLDGYVRISDDYRKFPVLEKACCKVIGGGREKKRERILSNQRFRLGSLHSEVMAHISKGPQPPTIRHAVVSQSDYKPWSALIDAAHKSSAWVVCIDPSVDEQQLQLLDDNNVNTREIIGFGTGVGSHGENNFTISTEHFAMADIEQRISGQISSLLGPWEQEECDRIAESLVRDAAHIAGLSIVKATGPLRYVRELIANAMVRKLLVRDDSLFCDEIISLDAFLHWFDDTALPMRPDLLRLRAKIINGYFHIEAQILECKLAQEGEGFLEKARQQLESGLRQLILNFKPREEDEPLGIEDNSKPDQRYWWMQLHRLIASKGQTSKSKYKETLLALERLSEGYYCITWQAAAVAFWTDNDSAIMNCEPAWEFSLEGQDLVISVASAGKEFIRKVCLEGAAGEIFCSPSKVSFECEACRQPDESVIEEEDEDEDKGESGSDTRDIQIEDEGDQLVVTSKRIPERILLGGGTAGGRDIYWEFGHPDLNNRHILVFGASGTGKTYTIQALLCELGKAGQNSLIVDYTNGFTNNQLEKIVIDMLKPKQHLIRKEPLAVNPFRQQCDIVDNEELPEDPATTAQRVSGVFSEVYQLGDQQKSALYSAIRTGIIQYGNNLNLNKLILLLEDIKNEGGPTGSSAASVISKIQPFVDMNPFGEEDPESWEKLFQDDSSRCHIIQLAGFVKDAARLITEFSLVDLYWYYRASGSKDKPKVIVLDEIQNLDHRLNSPLGQFLTEGRKFGISLILATQTLSNLDKDERDRLFQASHKLFFKPADTEIRSFAQIFADATGLKNEEWVRRLTSLKRGECYSLGPAVNEATGTFEVNRYFKIRIKALEDRY